MPDEPTPVLFRVDRAGKVFAVFPTLPVDWNPGTMAGADAAGLSHTCSVEWFKRDTIKAARHAYRSLLWLLRSRGCAVEVHERLTSRHHIARLAELKRRGG